MGRRSVIVRLTDEGATRLRRNADVATAGTRRRTVPGLA